MNAATKTALIFVFALGAIHLLLLIIGVMTGTPGDSNMVSWGGIGGRNSMWIPVFVWAWIPTTMMLAIGGLLVWVSIKYRHKKQPTLQYLENSKTN